MVGGMFTNGTRINHIQITKPEILQNRSKEVVVFFRL